MTFRAHLARASATALLSLGLCAALPSGARAAAPPASPSPSPKAKKVYTNVDLKDENGQPSTSASPAPTPAPSAAAASEGAARPTPPPPPTARRGRRRQQRDPGAETRRKNEGATADSETPSEQPATPAAEPPSAVTPPATPSDSGEAPIADDYESRQKDWHERAEARRDAVKNAEAAVVRAENEVGEISNRLMLSTDTNEILRLQQAKVDAETRLAQARQGFAAAREALERFEEEARRANVPPGWIRER